MDLLHATVHHQTFGPGEIVEIGGDFINVSFREQTGIKKFLFPAAFRQHLTLENNSLNAEMAALLEQNHIRVAAERQRAERADRIAQFRASSIEKANGSTKQKKKK